MIQRIDAALKKHYKTNKDNIIVAEFSNGILYLECNGPMWCQYPATIAKYILKRFKTVKAVHFQSGLVFYRVHFGLD